MIISFHYEHKERERERERERVQLPTQRERELEREYSRQATTTHTQSRSSPQLNEGQNPVGWFKPHNPKPCITKAKRESSCTKGKKE